LQIKIKNDAYLHLPWCVPVTVRPGPFVPHREALAPFNVQTDPGALGSFGARPRPIPAGELLHADLQTTPEYHAPGKLGAGRAGYYLGKYLKGVGRTPLCANWNQPGDQMHATGHLSVSSAVREQIVTWYLQGKGLGDRINGCEGLLIAPLCDSLRAYLPAARSGPHPCDAAMQALSVKGSAHARFSNFVWLMSNTDHFSSHEGLVRFLFLFARYLDPGAELALDQLTPTRIAGTFSAAIERTLRNFRDFWRAGVVWMFPLNNMTMDGRFHDLDLPTFVGGPFLGVVGDADRLERASIPSHDPMRVVGLTALGYVHHVRTFYKLLVARLALLLELDFAYASSERELLRQVLAALRAELSEDHLIFSMDRLAALLWSWIEEDAWIEPGLAARLREMVRRSCDRRVTLAATPSQDFALRPLDIAWARPGQRSSDKAVAVLAGSRIREEHLEEARFMNDLLSSLDAITDRDALFAALDDAERRIARRITPLAPR
jgi:hypothetical protein